MENKQIQIGQDGEVVTITLKEYENLVKMTKMFSTDNYVTIQVSELKRLQDIEKKHEDFIKTFFDK